MDLGGHSLFECEECGCWSSDASDRGALTSFEPSQYFDRAESDRDKWEDLRGRLEPTRWETLRVLDIGCGTAAYLRYLSEELGAASRLVGIEVDRERAARARTPDAKWVIREQDAQESLDEMQEQFDLVTLWDVLEHVPAPRRLLRSVGRRLAPDGIVYVQTIHENSLLPWIGRASHRLSRGRLRSFARRTHEAHHLVFFSLDGLRRMAKASGLRVRECWFGRLARDRMDGPPLVTAAAATLLTIENQLGNGLFVNMILEHDRS